MNKETALDFVKSIEQLPLEEKIDVINELRFALHCVSPFKT